METIARNVVPDETSLHMYTHNIHLYFCVQERIIIRIYKRYEFENPARSPIFVRLRWATGGGRGSEINYLEKQNARTRAQCI